jgi:hypothetical protein
MSYVLGMCRNMYKSLSKVSFTTVWFWTKLECQQTIVELSNTKFHENSFGGSQVITNGQACQSQQAQFCNFSFQTCQKE